MLQEEFIAFVGFLGSPETGELTHGPEPATVHIVVDTPGEGILPGEPQFFKVIIIQFRRQVQQVHRLAGYRIETVIANPGTPGLPLPLSPGSLSRSRNASILG
ncbi:hypothetical protein ES703_118884 [subsurface metagenome]